MEVIFFCFFFKPVLIYFSCLGGCYNPVLLWSIRNVLWTSNTSHHFTTSWWWADNDEIFIFGRTFPLTWSVKGSTQNQQLNPRNYKKKMCHPICNKPIITLIFQPYEDLWYDRARTPDNSCEVEYSSGVFWPLPEDKFMEVLSVKVVRQNKTWSKSHFDSRQKENSYKDLLTNTNNDKMNVKIRWSSSCHVRVNTVSAVFACRLSESVALE